MMVISSIIGRAVEQQKLSRLLESEQAEFLAIYGRRRVGKTFLIREFFVQQDCLFFQVTGLKDGKMKQQLSLFAKALENAFYSHLQLTPPTSWTAAFEMLTTAIKQEEPNRKIVLFLDELPWLTTKRSGLLQALDHYWNTDWVRNKNIKLVVCGSAASWMINKLLRAKGGLHNRVTSIISLQPFSLKEVQQYLSVRHVTLDKKQIVKLYMTIGGIPYYLNAVEEGLSATQVINRLCFQPNGLLFDEFEKLFSSLFNHAEAHKELIRIIAKKRQGVELNDLLKKSQRSSTGGRFKERLNELQEAGFITAYTPSHTKKKGTYYRIFDEFSLFYLTWIESAKRHSLLPAENNYWEVVAQTPAWKSWAGYAFESLCFKHINAIKRALGIEHVALSANAWRYLSSDTKLSNSGAQIDLIFDRSDGVITLCEIKYYENDFQIDKALALNIVNKINVYKQETKTKKQLFIAIISASRLKPNQYSSELVTNQVTLDDLFS